MLIHVALTFSLLWLLITTQAQEEAPLQYSAEFSDTVWNMPTTFHSRNAIWTSARYDPGGVLIAHGIALVVTHSVEGQNRYLNQDFFQKDDVNWEYLEESTTELAETDLGKVKYWNIVVEGKPTLKDAAWQYVETRKDSGIENLKRYVVFKEKTRPFHIGDGIYESGEVEGLHIVEDWFL